jgi:hypothetical protein
MSKLSIFAAAALMTLGLGAAAATPSFAESVASCQVDSTPINANGEGGHSFIQQDSAAILAGLRAKGINAQDVSSWGGCVRADVITRSGNVAMHFYDPNTLQRLSVNG